MEHVAAYLLSGLLFGLAAGLAPGPLLTLVISETLRNGRRAGVYVALAPLITDLPIIVGSLYVLSKMSGKESVLGVLTLTGGFFIAYMAYDCFTSDVTIPGESAPPPRSLGRGVLANLLSPHPYLFWMTVGGPIVVSAAGETYTAACAYLAGFYGLLVGTKVFIAVVTDRSKRFVGGAVHGYVLKALGMTLFVFCMVFIRDGLKLLGLL